MELREVKSGLKRKAWIAYVVMAALLTANSWFITEDDYLILGLPLLAVTGYIAFFHPSWLIVIIGFFTPLSVTYEVQPLASTFNFPTEPLISGLMLLFFFKLALDWKYDSRILLHPLSLLILLNLIWILVSTLFSTMPIVSWKFFFSRLWFVIVFYFVAVELFKNPKWFRYFVWAFSAALIIVVFSALHTHRGLGFDQDHSGWTVQPFFNDHTEYGAVLALIIPVMAGFLLKGKDFGLTYWERLIAGVILAVFLTGIFYSYSRASWLSLIGAGGAFILFWLRVRFWYLLAGILICVTLINAYQYEILYTLKKNQEVSDTDLEQHVHSMYNITTDASNTERINRWVAALRMYEEKPVTGWGPGTYMFQYAPFQHSKHMTIISTRMGDQGNAHSEYLGPLAEQGLPGLLTFVLIVLYSIYTGMNLYHNGKTPYIRSMALLVTLGLITYFIHGFLNNFLEFDKASVPFWSYMAVLTMLDLKNKGYNRKVE